MLAEESTSTVLPLDEALAQQQTRSKKQPPRPGRLFLVTMRYCFGGYALAGAVSLSFLAAK